MLKPLTIALAGLALACLPAHAQVNFAVRYLDCEAGDDANDGKTAATAKRTLQGALAGIPDGCHRPVEVHILSGDCLVEAEPSTGPVSPPCNPFPQGCATVGLWPDTRLLGSGASRILGTAEAPVKFVNRLECAPGGPSLEVRDLEFDLTGDQWGPILLPRRDVMWIQRSHFVNATEIPGPVRVAISDTGFAAGLTVGPACGYVKGSSFGGNTIGDANDALLRAVVRTGGKLRVSDSFLSSDYFERGAQFRCEGGNGSLLVEHNQFSLPADGAVSLLDSMDCKVRVLRNRFRYDSRWGNPGLGVAVLSATGVELELSGNSFDGAHAYTAVSVAAGSGLFLDAAYNTLARASSDTVVLGGGPTLKASLRGNAFYGIDGNAVRVDGAPGMLGLFFNNFDAVDTALCVAGSCSTTGADVNGSGWGSDNLDLVSGFQSPATFPADFHLTAASPLIDAADPQDVTPRRDQDGTFRPVDGDGDAQAVCDIGAFEFLPPPPGLGRDALRPRQAR